MPPSDPGAPDSAARTRRPSAVDRRTFLHHGLATGLLAASPTIPGFLARTAAAAASASGPGALDRRILVLVQLSGGNDGLNTVVPFRDDTYHRLRPTLRISAGQVRRISDDLGLHPALGGLHRLHEAGRLGVVTNVGYPHPDRSHFRSMDIWHACTSGAEPGDTGWLGRLADREGVPLAASVDDDALPLALRGRKVIAPTIGENAFDPVGDLTDVRAAAAAARPGASEDLEFVRRMSVAACDHAERLERAAAADRGQPAARTAAAAYPDVPLGRRLRRIARLVDADFGPRVYYATQDGYDTHARQDVSHAGLLQALGDSIAAFQADLDRRGIADRVLLMTFSEFGRRIAENGGRGTDHGAAAPMFVVGSGARPGVHGDLPDLSAGGDPGAAGDVPFRTDFRSVYAAALEHWLGLDSRGVIPAGHAAAASLVRR